jgi:hypothetical protein
MVGFEVVWGCPYDIELFSMDMFYPDSLKKWFVEIKVGFDWFCKKKMCKALNLVPLEEIKMV